MKHVLSRQKPVIFTRSRAYKKNDNAHVGQKNWTHVRQWLGYGRFDNKAVVKQINNLFGEEWRLYHNFFLPSAKLMEKKRVGSKLIKKHDRPKTSYRRLIESKHISDYQKDKLTVIFESLDPFLLKRAIEKKLRKILRMARKPSDYNRKPE